MQLVELNSIPIGEYQTPMDNLVKLFSTGQLMEKLCKENNGVGLAAAQVGLPWNFFVYWSNYPKKQSVFEYLVDCSYEPIGEKKSSSIESCLSLKNKYFQLDRYENILVSGKKIIVQDEGLDLVDFKQEFSGVVGVILQHEIDHKHGRNRMIDKIGKQIYLS